MAENIMISIMSDFFKRYKGPILVCGLALLCWGRVFTLKGLWVEDWVWVWHYFSSENLSEFMVPFKSLCHELGGCLFYFNFKLLDLFPGQAMKIWSVFKFLIFIINPLVLCYILKNTLNNKSILPKAIAIIYLVSPVINNLCTMEFVRRLYLCAFLLSILFSVRAASQGKLKMHYYLSAILFSLFSVLGMESYIFFEVCRPIIIFYIFFRRLECGFRAKAGKAILHWIPFVIIGTCVLVRSTGLLIPRSGIYADVYNVEFKNIFQIICQYINSIRYLFVDNVSHFVRNLSFIETEFFLMLMALIAALFAILVILSRKKPIEDDLNDHVLSNETLLVTVFGAFLIIVGLFPYIMVRGFPEFGIPSRHALEASVGVAIFTPSFLLTLYYKGFIKKQFYYFLLGGIVFLSVFQCNDAIKAYNNDWQQQRSFWWQFIWRVPDLKDNTYLLVDIPREESEYFTVWRGLGEFACPLNLLYAKSRNKEDINNHFAQSFDYSAFYRFEKQLYYLNSMDEQRVDYECYKGTIQYYPQNLMVASYHKGYLYLNHEVNNSNSSQTVNIDPLKTKLSEDQIIYKNNDKTFPFRWIIGPEPSRAGHVTVMDRVVRKIFHENRMLKDWRYYLQKAKLMEQLGDYQEIVNLYDEAERLQLVPQLSESIPLFIIKSFYITGKIDKGNSLLKAWAFSVDGSREKAMAMVELIEVTNNDPDVSLKIRKQIERIWGTTTISK